MATPGMSPGEVEADSCVVKYERQRLLGQDRFGRTELVQELKSKLAARDDDRDGFITLKDFREVLMSMKESEIYEMGEGDAEMPELKAAIEAQVDDVLRMTFGWDDWLQIEALLQTIMNDEPYAPRARPSAEKADLPREKEVRVEKALVLPATPRLTPTWVKEPAVEVQPAEARLATPTEGEAGAKASLMKFLEECKISSDLLESTADAFLVHGVNTKEDIEMLDQQKMRDILPPELATGIVLKISKHLRGASGSKTTLGFALLGGWSPWHQCCSAGIGQPDYR